jgi:hypothetical protein
LLVVKNGTLGPLVAVPFFKKKNAYMYNVIALYCESIFIACRAKTVSWI